MAAADLATNVAAGSNDTTNTSDKRERSKRPLPFFVLNAAVEKVHAIFRMNKPRMVKKLMRPHDGSISAVHPVFRESAWGWSPSPLSSHAAAVIHCPFPDDGVPDDNACHTR